LSKPFIASRSVSVEADAHRIWPSLVSEGFSDTTPNKWPVGSFSHEIAMTEFRINDGKYFCTLRFKKPRDWWIDSPYPPVVQFYTSVDAQLVESTIGEGVNIAILFGRESSRYYGFRISSTKHYGLTRFDGTKDHMIIDWTPISVDLNKPNRLAVLVEDQTIKIFLNSSLVGEYRDPAFSGGKVGLAVNSWGTGKATVEFDNFELRRKP
jgi:hypothetical protein